MAEPPSGTNYLMAPLPEYQHLHERHGPSLKGPAKGVGSLDECPPLRNQAASKRTHHAAGRKPKSQRFESFNAFIDHQMRKLRPASFGIWSILWRHTRSETGLAGVSRKMLAETSNLAAETVSRAVRDLVARGLVEVTHHGGPGRGFNTYRVYGEPQVDAACDTNNEASSQRGRGRRE